MVLVFFSFYFYFAHPYPAPNFSQILTKPTQLNWLLKDKSLRTDFPMSCRGGESYFLFKYPQCPLAHHHTRHTPVLTSPSKLWFCNLYLHLFFLLCSQYGCYWKQGQWSAFSNSKVWFCNLRKSGAPNISKFIADVFLSSKSKNKPNSYCILLLICLLCFYALKCFSRLLQKHNTKKPRVF